MRRAWQASSLVFFILCVLVLVESLSYPFLDTLGPGPGFFPVWLSVLAGALAAARFFQVTFATDGGGLEGTFAVEGRAGIAMILAGLLAVAVLMDVLGFRLTTFLFLICLTLGLGGRNWLVILPLSLGGSFGVFQVFYYGLRIPLPTGIFGI